MNKEQLIDRLLNNLDISGIIEEFDLMEEEIDRQGLTTLRQYKEYIENMYL